MRSSSNRQPGWRTATITCSCGKDTGFFRMRNHLIRLRGFSGGERITLRRSSMTEKIKDSDQARQADQAKHQARHPHHENLLAQGKQIAVDIRAEIARLKSEPAWAANDRHGSSLVKGDGINVALMMLKKGAKLQEHHTRAPITVQVIDGRVNFIANGKTQAVTAGTIVALDRAIEHSIEALEESALVLTVGGEQM